MDNNITYEAVFSLDDFTMDDIYKKDDEIETTDLQDVLDDLRLSQNEKKKGEIHWITWQTNLWIMNPQVMTPIRIPFPNPVQIPLWRKTLVIPLWRNLCPKP